MKGQKRASILGLGDAICRHMQSCCAASASQVKALKESTPCAYCRLPNLKITPASYSAGKATTQIMTAYLATDPGWTLGVAPQVPWPRCVQHLLTPRDILEAVSQAAGAIRSADASECLLINRTAQGYEGIVTFEIFSGTVHASA